MDPRLEAAVKGLGPCYLLNLPKELRLNIYDYALRPTQISILATFASFTRALHPAAAEELVRTAFHGSASRDVSPTNCKSCDLDPAEWRRLDISCLSLTRNLQDLHLVLYSDEVSAVEDVAHSRALVASLPATLRIRRLTVELWDHLASPVDEAEDTTSQVLATWKGKISASAYEITIEHDPFNTAIWSKNGKAGWFRRTTGGGIATGPDDELSRSKLLARAASEAFLDEAIATTMLAEDQAV